MAPRTLVMDGSAWSPGHWLSYMLALSAEKRGAWSSLLSDLSYLLREGAGTQGRNKAEISHLLAHSPQSQDGVEWDTEPTVFTLIATGVRCQYLTTSDPQRW